VERAVKEIETAAFVDPSMLRFSPFIVAGFDGSAEGVHGEELDSAERTVPWPSKGYNNYI
jgi:hypothetical protein